MVVGTTAKLFSNAFKGAADLSRSAVENMMEFAPGPIDKMRTIEKQSLYFAYTEQVHKANTQMDAKVWSNTKDILNNTLSKAA